jgi:hypothetical protein
MEHNTQESKNVKMNAKKVLRKSYENCQGMGAIIKQGKLKQTSLLY